MSKRLLTTIVLPLLALQGCQTLPEPPAQELESPRELETWTLDGRLGYRSGDDGGSASFHWVQKSPETGSIHFSGPLGFGSARIGWSPGNAWMEKGNDRVEAPTPGLLAWRLTGLILPIEGLRYWVRGLAAPSPAAAARRTNGDGRLRELTQAGWELEFDRYEDVAGVSLPHRIRATHDDERFTLLIRSWQPQP